MAGINFLTIEEEKELISPFIRILKRYGEVNLDELKEFSKRRKKFIIQLYTKYLKKVKEEIESVEVRNRRLEALKAFVLDLKEFFISTFFKYGGSVLGETLVIGYNLFYLNFKYTLLHESFHYLYHIKKYVGRKRMEEEATEGALILYQLPPFLAARNFKVSFKYFKNEWKKLREKTYFCELATPEEILELKERVNELKNYKEYLQKLNFYRKYAYNRQVNSQCKIPVKLCKINGEINYFFLFCNKKCARRYVKKI